MEETRYVFISQENGDGCKDWSRKLKFESLFAGARPGADSSSRLLRDGTGCSQQAARHRPANPARNPDSGRGFATRCLHASWTRTGASASACQNPKWRGGHQLRQRDHPLPCKLLPYKCSHIWTFCHWARYDFLKTCFWGSRQHLAHLRNPFTLVILCLWLIFSLASEMPGFGG